MKIKKKNFISNLLQVFFKEEKKIFDSNIYRPHSQVSFFFKNHYKIPISHDSNLLMIITTSTFSFK